MSTTLVVTTINPPTAAMRELATGCRDNQWAFFVAGDTKSPDSFQLDGCDFISIEQQKQSRFALARSCPKRSYTRKNLAYLHAIRSGALVIVETDDDNHPYPKFWAPRKSEVECTAVTSGEWVNVYGYFSDRFIYPRGLPLQHANRML